MDDMESILEELEKIFDNVYVVENPISIFEMIFLMPLSIDISKNFKNKNSKNLLN